MIGRMAGRPETLVELQEEGENALISEKPAMRTGRTGLAEGVDFQIRFDLKMPVSLKIKVFGRLGGLVPGIFHFFGGIGTGIGKNWYRKKVSEPVSEKFGTGKKSRNRYRKNLVPEKVPVSVSEKIWYRN